MKPNPIELKGEIPKPTTTVENLSMPIPTVARTTREKISKDRRTQQHHQPAGPYQQ